jgi:hypothetical protein
MGEFRGSSEPHNSIEINKDEFGSKLLINSISKYGNLYGKNATI